VPVWNKFPRPQESDAPLRKVLGCETPKLRFVTRAVRAASPEDAQRLIRETPRLDDVVILTTGEQRGVQRSAPQSGRDGAARLNVSRFAANEVVIEADVSAPDGGWLVYADSYTPDWHAEVNGQPVPVEEAYLAFKAVRLQSGSHVVRFWYHRGAYTTVSYALAVCGATIGALFVVAFLLVLVIRPQRVDDWGQFRRDLAHQWPYALFVSLVVVAVFACLFYMACRNPCA